MTFIHVRGMVRWLVALLLGACFCLPIMSASAGQIYKWRDAEGRLHFSDTPVNEETELLRETTAPPPAAPQPVKSAKVEAPAVDAEPEVIKIPYIAKEGGSSRVIIKVKLNDWVTAKMLVDTGAPGLIISTDLAAKLNLFDRNGSQLLTLVGGIGGSRVALRTIINKVSVGKVISETVIPAHIVPRMSDAYDGLIGMDILSGYSVTIDPSAEQLIAKPVPKDKDRPGGHGKEWWREKFWEFRAFRDYWIEQAELVDKLSGTAYARMVPQKREEYRKFIYKQRDEADAIFRKFEFKANDCFVPKHWRE